MARINIDLDRNEYSTFWEPMRKIEAGRPPRAARISPSSSSELFEERVRRAEYFLAGMTASCVLLAVVLLADRWI